MLGEFTHDGFQLIRSQRIGTTGGSLDVSVAEPDKRFQLIRSQRIGTTADFQKSICVSILAPIFADRFL